MTKDLVLIQKESNDVKREEYCSTEEFIDEVEKRIKAFYKF